MDPLTLPGMSDPLWNSVFGLALRRLTCIASDTGCEKCSLQTRCDYFLLTRGTATPGPSEQGLAERLKTRPPPLIFHGPVRDFSLRVPANATFSAGLVLVGNGNARVHTVLRALALAGDLGIGRDRGHFHLLQVLRTGPGPLNQYLFQGNDIPPPEAASLPKIPQLVIINLLTPWLLPNTLKYRHINEPKALVRDFLGKVIRRISLMQQCHTAHPLETDFKSLFKQIEKVNLNQADFDITTGYRHGKGRFTAVRGSFVLDMTEMEDIWPFLWTGQWLNVPKMAAKGFGRYEICALSSLYTEIC